MSSLHTLAAWAGAIVGLGIVGWAIFAVIRIRRLQSTVANSQVAKKDANAAQSISKLSKPELDALLSNDLSGSAGNPKT